MKTWEMIKMLTENPKLIFVCKKGEREYFLSAETVFNTFYKYQGKYKGELRTYEQLNFFGNISIDDDWQLVRTPVPWQEAIQAVLDSETVTCECKKCTCTDKPNECIFTLRDDFCAKGIKSGTWYIEDGDANG